jgi:hypothetical protein
MFVKFVIIIILAPTGKSVGSKYARKFEPMGLPVGALMKKEEFEIVTKFEPMGLPVGALKIAS